uniref:Neurotransmitter-gated ion-channel ligand-binding domain-containing protein n=1 Tax=Plectus sambesii TaxID=2011161 RepID=A0A914XJI2_9BILA
MKLLLTASFLIGFLSCKAFSSQRDVYASIFNGYQKDLRPVLDDNTTITVTVQPQIISLLEVNERQEYIKLAFYINQVWKDEFLTWDPKLFNGTDYIKVPASKVWLPDIVVESSSLEPEYIMSQDDRVVLIASDGTIFMSFPFVLTNYCKMNIKEYPFDTQQCTIKIMSWAYMKDEITLQSGTLADDADIPRNNNTVWDILPYVVETLDTEIENFGTFRELLYRQKIKRKPQYYVWVLIVPTFILTALSLAGLYSPFNNAGEREEKVTLGLTTLLTLAVILTMVTGDMPRGSELPIMGLFVLLEIIMIVVSMAISVLTMFLHQRATTRSCSVPNWLTSILFCHVKAT